MRREEWGKRERKRVSFILLMECYVAQFSPFSVSPSLTVCYSLSLPFLSISLCSFLFSPTLSPFPPFTNLSLRFPSFSLSFIPPFPHFLFFPYHLFLPFPPFLPISISPFFFLPRSSISNISSSPSYLLPPLYSSPFLYLLLSVYLPFPSLTPPSSPPLIPLFLLTFPYLNSSFLNPSSPSLPPSLSPFSHSLLPFICVTLLHSGRELRHRTFSLRYRKPLAFPSLPASLTTRLPFPSATYGKTPTGPSLSLREFPKLSRPPVLPT